MRTRTKGNDCLAAIPPGANVRLSAHFLISAILEPRVRDLVDDLLIDSSVKEERHA